MKDNSKEIGNLSLFKKGMIIATATMTTFAAMSANKAIFAADSENTETKPVLQYNAHVENIGWQGSKIADILEGNSQIVSTVRVGTTGQSLRMEALTVSLTGIPGASLKYNVHSENKGWTGWKENGEVAGTTGQSLRVEAIKICATGLNEAGYSLYYRAHVSDIGWMNWICADDSLNLTNYAGTTGQSLRMEAMEIVLVKNTAGELGLKEQKEECIANLEKYVIALGTTVLEGDTPEAKASQAKYNAITKEINSAKELINSEETDTIEKLLEIYENAITKIREAYSDINIDKLVEDVEKAADEKRAEVLEELEIYKDQVNKTDLLDSQKQIINSIIEKAENEINSAKTAGTVEKASENMDTILKTYTAYHLNVEKEKARCELRKYLDGASKGVKKVINEAIKDIDEVIDEEELAELMNGITVNDVMLGKQKEAEETLKLYEQALESDNLEITEANKAIIRNEIEEIRDRIDNAEKTEDITDAITDFENYMKTYYNDDVVKEKDNVKLQAEVKEAISKINEYATCGYEEVEKLAKEAKKEITEAEDEEKLKEALGKLDTTIAALDEAKEEAIEKEQEDQNNYNKTYKTAQEKLNKYRDIVNNPSILTAAEVKELNNLIANTEASLKNTTKTAEINEVMTVFEDYIKTYYADIETEAAQFTFNKTKEDAISTLNEYKDSKNATIKAKARTAISTIEAIKVDETTKDIDAQITKIEEAMEEFRIVLAKENAKNQLDELYGENKDADIISKIGEAKQNIDKATKVEDVKDDQGNVTTPGINTILEEAIEEIDALIAEKEKAARVENAQVEAVSKLREYVTNATVSSIASKAINDIVACNEIEDTEVDGVTVKGITTLLNEAIEEINEALGLENKTDAEKLAEAQAEALKTIEGYKTIANELGFTQLSNKLKVYENAITDSSITEAGIENILNQVEDYVETNYPLLHQKSEAINAIKTKYLPEDEKEVNFKYKKYTEYTNAVEKVIKAIKEIEEVEGTEIDTTELEKEITTVINKITAYETAQSEAVTAINAKVTAGNKAQEALASSWITDVNKITYAQYLRYEANKEEGDTTTVFTQIVTNATKDIAAVATV